MKTILKCLHLVIILAIITALIHDTIQWRLHVGWRTDAEVKNLELAKVKPNQPEQITQYFLTPSTHEWSLVWSNGCPRPIAVYRVGERQILEQWNLTRETKPLPEWSQWSEPMIIHPQSPFMSEWFFAQFRTNELTGMVEIRKP